MYVRKGQRQLALRPPQGCKQVSGESILAQCRAMGSMPGRGLWDTGTPVPKGFKERAALGMKKVAYLVCVWGGCTAYGRPRRSPGTPCWVLLSVPSFGPRWRAGDAHSL